MYKSTLRAFLVSVTVTFALPLTACAGDEARPLIPDKVQNAPSTLIRNIGGVAGAVGGGVGGSWLANKIVASPAIAGQGPLLTRGIGIALPVVGAVLAARALSLGGNELDRLVGAKTSGTVIGAAAGALGGLAFLSKLKVFGGPSGMVAAALLGAVAGGIGGSLASGPVNWATNPTILGGLTGGIFGFRGGGVLGGLAGLALGGVTGYTMDKMLFAKQDERLKDSIPSIPSIPKIPYLSGSSSGEAASAMTQPLETVQAPQDSQGWRPSFPTSNDPLNADEQIRWNQ